MNLELCSCCSKIFESEDNENLCRDCIELAEMCACCGSAVGSNKDEDGFCFSCSDECSVDIGEYK